MCDKMYAEQNIHVSASYEYVLMHYSAEKSRLSQRRKDTDVHAEVDMRLLSDEGVVPARPQREGAGASVSLSLQALSSAPTVGGQCCCTFLDPW